MRPLLCALGLLLIVLVTPAVAAEKLRLVADSWPPFTDSDLPGGGLATNIVTAALTRAGYTSNVEQVPWARALMGIGEGRYDILVNTVQRLAHASGRIFQTLPSTASACSGRKIRL